MTALPNHPACDRNGRFEESRPGEPGHAEGLHFQHFRPRPNRYLSQILLGPL